MLSKTRQMWLFVVLLIPAVALFLGAFPTAGWAQDEEADCWFNIEFNATDLDVGVRGFFDFEPWNALSIEDPNSSVIADVAASNSLLLQGFAEWFFESGEPTLDDLSFADFFDRFPETYGDGGKFYTFTATPNEGDDVECEAEFTHVIPCEPEISASGNRGLGVTISWDPVTQIVDTVATENNVEVGLEEPLVCVDSEDLEIVGYEVIVETEADGEEKEYKIDLPGNATSVSVPPEFIALSYEFEYEVLAIEDSGNQTISEEEFCVNERNGHVEECPDDDDEE
jgi:hypothetical protein